MKLPQVTDLKRLWLYLQWQTMAVLEHLSVWSAVNIVLLIWLLGVWGWIIPSYHFQQADLQHEIERLSHFQKVIHLAEPPVARIVDVPAVELPAISYDQLLALSNKHQVRLIEYHKAGSDDDHHDHQQCVLLGSWLASRAFLNDLQPAGNQAFHPIKILNMTLTRDNQTNQVHMNLVLEVS